MCSVYKKNAQVIVKYIGKASRCLTRKTGSCV